MKDLMKLIESKKDSKMDEGEAGAKSEMLMELIKMASSAAGDDIKKGLDGNMQEVTVSAPDEEGLKEGLEMAEDVVEDGPESLMPDTLGDMDDMEDEDMSEEEIEAEIQRLMEMKKSKMIGE